VAITGPTPRLLLTGATGFIGGACRTRALGFAGEVHAVNQSGRGPDADRIVWHAADLRDPAEAARLVRQVRPTHCLHIAWIAKPGVYLTSPENLDWLQGGVALARTFGEEGGRRFVGAGTCAEYDWSAERFVEDGTPLTGGSPYGRCKAALWNAVQASADVHGFSAAWGRIFFPYGPGDAPARLIPSVIRSLRAGEELATTEGLQERDFVFVDDVADLLLSLVESGHAGAFNVGTGEGASVRSVVSALAGRLGGLTQIRFGAKAAAPHEPPRLVADMTKVRSALGWRPAWSLERGLDACIEASAVASAQSP
jgi:nucleoside-diphosphate-sugar epimerase